MSSPSIRDIVRQARKLWSVEHVPPHINRHNRKAWIRSVLRLGPHWVALRKVGRL